MANKTDWTLIARYLSDNASPQDKHSVLDWTLTDPQNHTKLEEATKVWKHAGVKITPPTVETETEWAELLRRIDEESIAPAPDDSKRRTLRIIGIVCGCLAIAAVAGYIFLSDEEPSASGRLTYIATS